MRYARASDLFIALLLDAELAANQVHDRPRAADSGEAETRLHPLM
jgi:hypothetical protein